MIVYDKVSSIEEIQQILELQKANLPENLKNGRKDAAGFVTVEHTLEVLTRMNHVLPHTVAKSEGKVIGYALSMTVDFVDEFAVLKPMFFEINKIFPDEKYVVMGQICIDKAFRKKGVFKGLYAFMKNKICLHRYKFIITEIDLKNRPSIKAHESVGFINLKEYQFGDNSWRIVALAV